MRDEPAASDSLDMVEPASPLARQERTLQVEVERLAHLKRQMPLVLLANILVGPFVGLVLRGTLGTGGAIAWAGGLALLSLLRWVWVLRLEAPRSGTERKQQAAFYVAGSGLSGILWGLLGALAIEGGQGLDAVYALMFLCGMVAGAIGSLSTLPPVYFAFSIPAVLPVIILYGLDANPASNIYAFAAAIFLVVNLGYAVNLGRTVRRTIELRFENEDLISRLDAARGRAERESELKSRFLQSASHDLRQPLHAVTLLLADLSEQIPEAGGEKLAQAQSSVLSLSHLLDRLLEASRAGAGDLKPTLAPVSLTALLRNLSFEYGPEARDLGLKLTIRETRLTARTDAVMLTQILRNFLSNALRHGKRRVLVGARRRGHLVRLEVWDDGPGIPPGQEKAIYDAFYQIGNPTRDPRRGHGLGLAIVLSMSRLLGVRHGVRSWPGKGSVFHVELPLAPAVDPVPLPQDACPVPAQKAPLPAGAGRVLVIEDNDELRGITVGLLRRWGHEVVGAEDGRSALETVRSGFRPDVLITDLLLPGPLDGLAAASALRTLLARPLPVAIVTGNAGALDQGLREDARAGGMTVLKKPPVPGRLKAWLSAELARARSDA